MMRHDGYRDEQLVRVYAPIGLDLGGPTPAEIALAILAEIVAVRRGKLAEGKGVIRIRRDHRDS